MKGAIYLFHILFVVSLLMYLGFQIYNQQKIERNVGAFLIILAFVILFYHAYRLYTVNK
jgi:hypothetical protein